MSIEFIVTSLVTPMLYAPLGAALYFLGSRATLTRPIWSRYPKRLDSFMLCAACSGFWYGVGLAFGIGWYLDVPFLLLPGRFWLTPLIVGLCSLVFTPWLAAKHLAALEWTTPGATSATSDATPATAGVEAQPEPAPQPNDEKVFVGPAEEEARRG
jgi:hypothetical protein